MRHADDATSPLRVAARAAEAVRIVQALRETRGSMTLAARSLGLTRQGLYQAARRCGVDVAAVRRAICDAAQDTP
jgi:transcriptional regulator with GAF, ATPase, and Fis domain